MCGTYSDPDLIPQFVLEARDLLQSIEQDLIALEFSPENDETLNLMFRALHTIKGTSAFLGIEPVAHLSHRAEDVLSGLRGRAVQSLGEPQMFGWPPAISSAKWLTISTATRRQVVRPIICLQN